MTATNAGRDRRGRRFLLAGAAAGPLFFAVVVAQALTRPGFSIARHPLSLLSAGSAGWVQCVNFAIAGLLACAGAKGLIRPARSRFGSAWGPYCVGVFGIGTVLAGLFAPDPAFGFPPGTPEGVPQAMSTHSMLHGLCFDAAFLALIVATAIFGFGYRRCRLRGFAAFSFSCSIALPALVAGGLTAGSGLGSWFFAAGAVGFCWLTAVCLEMARANDA